MESDLQERNRVKSECPSPVTKAPLVMYKRRIGPIDKNHPYDQQRMVIMKINKKIAKILRKKRPRTKDYHDPDYELSDSDEDEVLDLMDMDAHPEIGPQTLFSSLAERVRALQASRLQAREQLESMTVATHV
jgi:hypothetical protein